MVYLYGRECDNMNKSKKRELILIIISLIILITIMCYNVFIKENIYTVTINPNFNNSFAETIQLKEGSLISSIKIPTRSGYSFLYWTYKGIKVNSNDKIYKDMELYAIWEAKK